MRHSALSLFRNGILSFISILFFTIFNLPLKAQLFTEAEAPYTLADTLRGSITPQRQWFDIKYYDLNIKVNPEQKTISGYNNIYFTPLQSGRVMQIDLFENMQVDSIVYRKQKLTYERKFNAVFINFPDAVTPTGKAQSIRFYYSGAPIVAKRPPWDGGFVWTKDEKNNPFIGVACQGTGASLWWPNKDHQSDEPDSMRLSCAVPNALQCVANGQNKGTTNEGDYTRYHWFVSYPINNYAVSVTIGNFARFTDVYVSGKDTLQLNYYVLAYNLEKAKKQFEQVKPMLACYEKFLGPYPFWRDGFALVETPYLGMEHQSGIAYGNNYKNGYNGMDYSRIGVDFDYIIIHEAGHEWWGNSLTTADIADMWVHEGFCTYTESLYIECLYGKEKALQYVNAKIPWVSNDGPIIGPYGVNREGSGDMYNKGMLILNTLRSVTDNDELWFAMIKDLQTEYKHRIVTQDTILQYFTQKTGKDLTAFFKQYLFYPNIPTLEYKIEKHKKGTQLAYRWKADVPGFDMPVKLLDENGAYQLLQPETGKWKTLNLKTGKNANVQFAQDLYYINVQKM
ncbi:M1 family peptidase [Sphingobacteriales bacterium UPWRP_1]|nr:peptidase M1 [Sphingobacteriales bacterium TSM_CSM]PSJ74165.1 M1 family peptidase [Sphingobacteriales bacterium UPWRP_1]